MFRVVKSERMCATSAGSRGDDVGALLPAVRAGDVRATRTFVMAIGPHLLRVVRRVLGPEHPDVEDVTQEAVYGVLEALPRYRGECSVLHFACRVAVLTAMNVRRIDGAEKRQRLRPSPREVERLPSQRLGPERETAQQRIVAALRELLARLPAPQAEALALHCVVGYTVAEIASSSGISVETVRSRLRLAKQALRRELASDPALLESVGGGA